MTPTPPCVMTFAATDPSGGAGLQADILTLASIGCHPLSVVTGITAQDTVGVESVMALDSDSVNDQARTILEDVQVAAFKLGLLGSVENVAVIAEIVADYPNVPLLIDPVLTSGRGDELANEEMQAAMSELLFPQATLITPNSLEARRLAFYDDNEEVKNTSLDEAALRLLEMGTEYVLITGTHERTHDVVNTLYGAASQASNALIKAYHWERLPGSYHGSGCTLTSAIAACLAHGLTMEEAIQEAQEYAWQTLKNGFRPGMGQFIPDRFFGRAMTMTPKRYMTKARLFNTSASISGLYAITPDELDTERLCIKVEAALQGGVKLLQYRNKIANHDLRFWQATVLLKLCRAHSATFIINDHLELCEQLDADGVHLGGSDGDLAAARQRLGEAKIIGASCYNQLVLAQQAVQSGANYVAFGACFSSSTKPNAVNAPLSLFAQAKSLNVPLVAIGGITLTNAPQIMQAGADAVAVVNALFDADDIGSQAKQFSQLLAS